MARVEFDEIDDQCADGDVGPAVAAVERPASRRAPVGASDAADGASDSVREPVAAAAAAPQVEQKLPPEVAQPQATDVTTAVKGDDDAGNMGNSRPSTLKADGSSNSVEEKDEAQANAAAAQAAAVAPETPETPAAVSSERLAQAADPARVIVQALQEKKNELGSALTAPRCGHLCRVDAKVTPADQKCLEPACNLHDLAVCAACSDNFHASDELRKHRQSMVSTCPQCQLEPSYYYCLNCDLSFCAPCFRAIHVPSKVQTHKTFTMEGASAAVLSTAAGSRAAQAKISQILAADTTQAVSSTSAQTPQAGRINAAASPAFTATQGAPESAPVSRLTRLSAEEVPSTLSARIAEFAELGQRLREDRASTTVSLGDKRKRDAADLLDVIMVDSDSDADDHVVPEEAPASRRNSQDRGLRNPDYRSVSGATGVPPLATVRSASSTSSAPPQPPPYAFVTWPQSSGSNKTNFVPATNNHGSFMREPEASQPPPVVAPQSLAIEPFNRATRSKFLQMQNLGLGRIVSSDAYDTDSSAGIIDPTSLHADTPTSSRIEEPPAPFAAPASVAPPPVVVPPPQQATADGWGASSTGSSPMGMYAGHAPNDFPVDVGSAHDPHAAAGFPSSAAVGTGGSSTLITTSADWTANPLEDVLYDRYFQINLYTVNLEQHVTRLSARIVQASVENLVAAQQMTVTLRQQQALLRKAQLSRNSALVALIVQSSSIMAKVKRLRMTMLSDISQVPISSHRRCLELSQQITLYTSNIATLHQQMAVVLDSSGGMDPETFHQNVSSVNQALQANEQSIQSWKEERENEIVRVVQYSSTIREDLKRTFHGGQKQPTPGYPQPQPQPPHPPTHPPTPPTTNGYYR